MNEIILNDNFVFNNYIFTHRHYTDNRKGSPRNYLAYMIKGQVKIVSDSKTMLINEGDVFYIPKNLSYQSYWYGEGEINFLSFGFLSLNTNENLKFELQVVPCEKQIIEKILAIPTQGKNVNCKTLSLFYDVMSAINPNLKYQSESKDEIIVEKIEHCIQKNPHCSIAEVASMCMISEPYLYTLFKKVTHITPNDYKQKILCEMGIELLLTTDKKIEEITTILKFSSSSYFRKVFFKHMGMTPREARHITL